MMKFLHKYALIFCVFLNHFICAQPACDDYDDWNGGTTYHSDDYVNYNNKVYKNRYDWNSSGEAPTNCIVTVPAWCTGGHQWYDEGGCTTCTDRTVGVATSSPTPCINSAMTSITHSTTEVTGITSSSGLPSGVSASYSSNTITISGTPTASGTFNYTITPTSDCGSATATGTITVIAVPTISGSVAGSRCNSGTVEIQASASVGSIEWFTASSGGGSIGSSASGVNWTTPNISGTTTYYAEALNGACVSASRTAVTATKNIASVGPGGITDELFLWLRADAGTGSIGTSWEDQSCNGFDYSTVSGPTKESSDWNYNPAIEILSGGFNAPSGSEIGVDWTVFFVSKLMASDYSGRLFEAHSGNYLLGYHGGYRNGIYWNGSPSEYNSGISSTSDVQTPHVFTYVREDAGGTIDARVDGDALKTFSSTNSGSGIRFDINQGTYSGSQSTDSRVGEFIIFNKELSASEIMKVEAYLASKYGIELNDADGSTGGDYISTGGTTYWDASGSTGYNNDILVLGKDDDTALEQKQAKSLDDSLVIFMSSLAADNSANGGSITNDESFIAIGHNGGKLKSNTASIAEMPVGAYSRLEREWKITNTNFDDNFSIEIEWDSAGAFDINECRLLVDNDGDFSDASIYSSSDGITFSVGSIIIGNLSSTFFPKGQSKYFTIASASSLLTLPVELLNFSAESVDEIVLLEWTTTAEVNNDYFVIQKSGDGYNWNQISVISGAGNSVEQIDYSFADADKWDGVTYYRLVQVDFDGSSKEYDAIVLNNSGTATGCGFCLEVNPNPIQNEANVKFTVARSDNYLFQVFNDEGQLIQREILKGIKGINYKLVNTSNFAPGAYIFSLSGSNMEFEKVMVVKH